MDLTIKSLSRSTKYYKNNDIIKYIVYFISVAICLGYIINNNLLPLIFFIIFTGIIYYLNNNLIIALISSIVVTNLLIALKLFDNIEGNENIRLDKDETDKSREKNNQRPSPSKKQSKPPKPDARTKDDAKEEIDDARVKAVRIRNTDAASVPST
jgi:hypothetical protein